MIYRDGGNDLIIGGTGKNALVGGTGRDSFIFRSRSESGKTAGTRDAVSDFTRGDEVDLSYIDADTTQSGNQKFTFVSKFTERPGELQWDENSKGFMVSVDVNGNGTVDFSIQLNTSLSSLHSSDLIL